MKLLIATPCFNGEMNTRYFQSFLATMTFLQEHNVQMSVITSDRDNIISRARNACAQVALDNDFDKVLFIDSDTVWRPEQVLMLLKSDKSIIGGTYPYKNFPIRMVVNPLEEHFKHYGTDRSMKTYKEYVEKCADPITHEVEVAHLPTGFMLIDVSVFRELTKTRPRYSSWDIITNTQKEYYDFFPIRIVENPVTKVSVYETEDWGFCSVARLEAGVKVHLQTRCIVDHLGFHQYSVQGSL